MKTKKILIEVEVPEGCEISGGVYVDLEGTHWSTGAYSIIDQPDELSEHLRQYKHNDGSDGFVMAYEQAGAKLHVARLNSEQSVLREELAAREKQVDYLSELLAKSYDEQSRAVAPQAQGAVGWKTWGGDRCNHCCTGMGECDDPEHYEREKCPYCKGTGRAIWLEKPPAPQVVSDGWLDAGVELPSEADGEVLVRMADGRCEIAWAAYWHGASNDFSQWVFRDPDETDLPVCWMHIPKLSATPQPSEKVEDGRAALIDSMCMTWRHDFGITKELDMGGLWTGSAGMLEVERESLRRQMRQLLDHHGKAIAAVVNAITPMQRRN